MSVFNGEKYLREAVDSILNQTFTDFEFIIINDGSTDNTKAILESYNDRRISLIHQKNIGLTKSLNKALFLSVGNYIARQDSDDISEPERLKHQIEFLTKNSDIAVTGSFVVAIDKYGNEFTKWTYPETDKDIKTQLLKNNIFCHGSVMFRKDCVMNVGYYREAFRTSQDYDLWLRISEKYNMANIPQYLYKLRRNIASITRRNMEQQINNHLLAIELAKERRIIGNDSLNEIDMDKIILYLRKKYKIKYKNIIKQKSIFYFAYCKESVQLHEYNEALVLWLRSFVCFPNINKIRYLIKTIFSLSINNNL